MPVFHIEMRWRCAACEAENLGRFKACQGCGKAKENEPFYDAPETVAPTPQQGVTDQTLIAMATAGPDWACKFCGSHQRRSSGECANCGASEVEAAKDAEPPPADLGYARHLSRSVPAPPPIPIEPKPWWEPLRGVPLVWMIVPLLAAVSIVTVLFLFRTRVIEATVVSRSWEHRVNVERYQVVPGEGFTRPPGAFEVTPRGQRHHHDDRVRDGTTRESYTEQVACGQDCSTTAVRCSSNDNGFKTCSGGDQVCSTKYCSETRYRDVPRYKTVPVYAEWYSWKSWQWAHQRTVMDSGAFEHPTWPSAERVALGRDLGKGESERSSNDPKYEIVFVDDDHKQRKVMVKGLETFNRMRKGSKHQLEVGLGRDPRLIGQE